MEKEHYENIIELLKRTLSFYSNVDNYVQNKNLNSKLISMIELDGGEQARKIIEHVNKLLKQEENVEDDYLKLIKNKKEDLTELKEKIIKDIKDLKNGY